MSEKRAQLAAELAAELPHFTGTEEYHRIVYPWLRNTPFLLTDGAKHLADKAGVIGGTAYWLIDILASYQREKPVKDEPFQVWKLTVNEKQQATLVCTDGNEHILAQQEIPYTSFPLAEITLYAEQSDYLGGRVVMLTSEY